MSRINSTLILVVSYSATHRYLEKEKNLASSSFGNFQIISVSQVVLEEILDLDVSVTETDDFLQLVSGGKVGFGFVPLAHRYGGHQVSVIVFLLYNNIVAFTI